MFAYLSKKIAMPNNTRVECVSWSADQGYLGIGGEKGLLKIIKFDDRKTATGSSSSSVNLSTNQTLGQHTKTVKIVLWNENYRKLTTSDETGLIIVWMNQQEYWFEEMINNRQKSSVADMKWSPDGTRICIIYEDGAVIVGSVEGNRQWGKELKHRLQLAEWSPDCKMLLFSTPEGEVRCYDANGNHLYQVKIQCLRGLIDSAKIYTPGMRLAALQWYENSKMYTDDTPPGLCIAYECGRIQLMKSEKDEEPIIFDSNMTIICVRWNPSGNIFAVSGFLTETGQTKGIVQFFNNQGYHLRSLMINNTDKINSISWEGTGLRLAMATGSSIYYANIKPDYKWGYMDNTIVFAYQKSDRIDYCVIFWDLKTEQKTLKYIKNLQAIKTYAEFCILVSKMDDQSGNYIIVLCNSIGSPIDSKYINIEPTYAYMTKTHVIICSTEHAYIWQYRNQTSRLTSFENVGGQRKLGRETAFFIDENPQPGTVYDKDKYSKENKTTNDPISAITATENLLMIGRGSGSVHKYALPHISAEGKIFLKSRPFIMELSCDSQKLATIDTNGTLSFFEMSPQGSGSILDFEKPEVWQVKWSVDNPNYLVFMEKGRMNAMRGKEVEEPVLTDGYICNFSDLQVKCVLLDDIMKNPDANFKTPELIIDFETKSLKDIRDVLNKNSLKDAFTHIEANPHIKLWKLFAEKALDVLDFQMAEKAFAKCDDYQSIQLCRRLQLIDDKNKQKAEILAFYGKFDEAEALYKKMERKDLAIQLRMKIGDWFKVVQLIKEGYGNDDLLMQAYDKIGDYYVDRFKWNLAAQYYNLSKNYLALMEAYFNGENCEGLEKLVEQLPEGSPLLNDLAEKLQSIGLCEAAVKAYQKMGNVKKALDCCILLNQWNLAVEIAEKNGFVQIEGLLSTYANQLLEKRKKLECVELYRRANRNTEAAKMLSQIAQDLVNQNANPMFIKKLFVMAALEVDSYKKRLLDASITGQGMTTAKTLDSLITSDINTSTDKALNNPWRGAEAWHFYILAQRQLYAGAYKAALKTSLRLAEYELELDTKKVYSLIALAAYYAKHWKEASRAFVKLEAMESLTDQEREKYQAVAVAIFTRNVPREPECEVLTCIGKNCQANITEFDTNCRSCGSNFQPCVVSGRSIFQKEYYTCKTCKHKSIESELLKNNLRHCLFCHAPIDFKNVKLAQQ